MALEIELKLRCASLAEIRQRLVALHARPLARAFERNILLDTAEQRLRAGDCGLRVRLAQDLAADAPDGWRGSLTFKGPRRAALAGLKTRDEIEIEISNGPATIELLGRLGFSPYVEYEKRRETWRLETCLVALDELPRLGEFVEIEGPDPEAVCGGRAALGLQDAPAVDQTYVALAWRNGQADADRVRRLVF